MSNKVNELKELFLKTQQSNLLLKSKKNELMQELEGRTFIVESTQHKENNFLVGNIYTINNLDQDTTGEVIVQAKENNRLFQLSRIRIIDESERQTLEGAKVFNLSDYRKKVA